MTKGRIRKMYAKKSKFYRLVVSAPDGRFGGDDIVGGLDEKTAIHEAKKLIEYGMTVDIFNSRV